MKKNILVVEDEYYIRESLQEALESEGYLVHTAAHGGHALEMMERFLPDLILLDLLMPTVDGAEFRRRQLAHPRMANIPVLLMSADSFLRRKAEKLGLPFIKKPLDLDQLFTAVNNFFEATGSNDLKIHQHRHMIRTQRPRNIP